MSKLQSNMSPNMTMDNQFNLFSLEDGSGEAGFEKYWVCDAQKIGENPKVSNLGVVGKLFEMKLQIKLGTRCNAEQR